jgi:hypothetical protein
VRTLVISTTELRSGVSILARGTIHSLPQGDLTEEADSNLYVNPLEATEKCGTGRVKKSISGEIGRNVSTDASPSVESLKEIRPSNEASKINLNDAIPKHRKIRIQQVSSLIDLLYLEPLAYSVCVYQCYQRMK